MAMLAADVGANAANTATTATSEGSGLSGGRKAGVVGKALPKPRTHHPYIVGITLMAVGGFALVGSITGALPSMLAALFVPNALVDAGGNLPIALQAFITAVGNNPTQGGVDAATILLAGS